MTQVLDHGYIRLVETWGSDERIVEAARMSTGKGFLGWGGDALCTKCGRNASAVPSQKYCGRGDDKDNGHSWKVVETPGDEKLLAYLYNNKHSTPFEMAGLVIEVKAPIFVFREWHRHRTQSYNEMSARYIPLPDENYVPDISRLLDGANTATANKQAQGKGGLSNSDAVLWSERLRQHYANAQQLYADGIDMGVPKELARLPVPVSRYSRMRASANLRNWLGFLTLRMDPAAQWEIRQYANAVGSLIETNFPRTWELFSKEAS